MSHKIIDTWYITSQMYIYRSKRKCVPKKGVSTVKKSKDVVLN